MREELRERKDSRKWELSKKRALKGHIETTWIRCEAEQRSSSQSFGGSGFGQLWEAYTNYRSFPLVKFQWAHSLSEVHPFHSYLMKKREREQNQARERRETQEEREKNQKNSQSALLDHLSATVFRSLYHYALSSFATLMSPPVSTQQVWHTQDQQPPFTNFLSNLISLNPKEVQTPSPLPLLSSTQLLLLKTRSLCKAPIPLKGCLRALGPVF